MVEDIRKHIDIIKLLNEKYLDLSNRKGCVSIDNPVATYFMKHALNEDFVNEGLIKTYPISNTINYIKNRFSLNDDEIISAKGENDIDVIDVTIPEYGNNEKIITTAMNVCGYHYNSIRQKIVENGIIFVTIRYEPKFENDISEELRKKQQFLYHITPNYNKEKIRNIGFSPKAKNGLFKYPNRVYFVLGDVSQRQLFGLGYQLYLNNKSLGNTAEYVFFKLDLDKIPSTIPFYKDPDYMYGVFTTSNIKPDCIVDIGRFDYNGVIEPDSKIKWLNYGK